jgi:hypothetical protein
LGSTLLGSLAPPRPHCAEGVLLMVPLQLPRALIAELLSNVPCAELMVLFEKILPRTRNVRLPLTVVVSPGSPEPTVASVRIALSGAFAPLT